MTTLTPSLDAMTSAAKMDAYLMNLVLPFRKFPIQAHRTNLDAAPASGFKPLKLSLVNPPIGGLYPTA